MHNTNATADRVPARIGTLLVKDGVVSAAQLDEALDRQRAHGGKLVENLIALEYLDTQSFVRFLSKQPETASINLLDYTIPVDVIALVNPQFARKHQLIPIDKMGRDLTVGMVCPLDAHTLSELEAMTGMKVRPLFVSIADVATALDNYYPIDKIDAHSYSTDPGGDISLSARLVSPGSAPMGRVESGMKFEKVVSLIRKLSALPALPETIVQVRRAMGDDQISTADMAAIIGGDPSLAVKVVSLANSAAYSFSHKVDTIERATALLGLREVYGVVVCSAVVDYFEEGKHFDHKKFWKRSMTCAAATRLIAKTRRIRGVDGVFAAGLMYDIGRAALAEVAPKPYAEVDQNLPEGALIQAENGLFGLAHPEVGFLIADGWGLPAEITEPIRFHHDFKQAQRHPELVSVVALGAVIADAFDGASQPDITALAASNAPLLEALTIDTNQLESICRETKEALNRQEMAV